MGAMLNWIIPAFILLSAAVMTLWMSGALYYDVCQEARWSRWLVAALACGVLLLFVAWQPLWQALAILIGILALFLAWWLRQKPSHNRDWDPAVAVLPRAVRAGDVVTIESVRNFEYRSSLDDFEPRYETRAYHLANLKGADILFFTWGSLWMSHPVLVFDFGSDGRLCASIEVRYRKGQMYSIVRSLYRQQELIFVVADERDVVLRRTKFGRQKAYLYRLAVNEEELRTVFLDYVEAINSLYETPRWYHGLCANCTTTFYRLPSRKCRFDWRVLANGRLDRALYESGRFDRTLPFTELRRLAFLNEIANCTPKDGFGDRIRHELERRRHGR